MKTIVKALVTFFALFVLSNSVFADPPPASHDYWRNTNYPGHYVMYDAATRTYVETIDCKVYYRFTLVKNELNTLTIYDRSRDMTVRLDYNGMSLKPSGASAFTFYQAGTFDTRTRFYNYNQDGSLASIISKGNSCQWKEWFSGATAPTFYFVEKVTNNASVELYDGSRNMWVRLDAGAMYLKSGNAPYGYFHAGAWH